MKIQLTPDEVKAIIRRHFPTSTEICFVEEYGAVRGEMTWDYVEVTLPLDAPSPLPELTDEEVTKIINGVMREKSREAAIKEFGDILAPEPPPDRVTAVCAHCGGSWNIHEPGCVALHPPPAHCSHCPGSVINHAPGCSRPSDIDSLDAEAFERATAGGKACNRVACQVAGQHIGNCEHAPLPNQDEATCNIGAFCDLKPGHPGPCNDHIAPF